MWSEKYFFALIAVHNFLASAQLMAGNNKVASKQDEIVVARPERLLVSMKTGLRQDNSGGPPTPYTRAKQALSLPELVVYENATDSILTDVKEGLQYIFQTKNDYTFAVVGTATTGCFAVLDALVEKGDKVLILENGYWGDMQANMSERLDSQVIRYKNPPGTVFSLQDFQAALQFHRPDVVVLTLGESSTAIYQPLDGFGELCEKYGVLLVADVTAVAGVQPVQMDKNKIDAVYTNSQKGIGAATGLAPVSLSPRAVQKLKNRQKPPRAYHTDLSKIAEVWNTANPSRFRFHTLSLPLLYSTREGLATIVEEKIENVWKRHQLATTQLYRGLEALGLEYTIKDPKDRLIGTTMMNPPRGKDLAKVASYMRQNHGVVISTGFGPMAGKGLRFATTASNADSAKVTQLLMSLKMALQSEETNL